MCTLACAKMYTLNMEMYAGKHPKRPLNLQNSGLEVVKRIIEPVSRTGRSITTDNIYSKEK